MVVVSCGVQIRDCDGGMGERREQSKSCSGCDEVECSIIDEFGGVGVPVVVVFVVWVPVWVLRWGELGGWDVDG